MSGTIEPPAPGSEWRNRKDRKIYKVPLAADDDGVIAVNDGACWSGTVEQFNEEFEETT